MSQRKLLFAAVLMFATVMASSAFAARMAPPTIGKRVAESDAIVIGKVESIEDKTVKAKPIYGGDEVEFQVAVVKVADGVSGVKGLTHVKVAFQPPVNQPGGGPIGPGRRFPMPKLEKDQEVCLFLTKHPDESFYVFKNVYDILDKKTDTFEKDVEQVKKFAKLLDDADKSLKSKESDERLLTAALLVMKYRTAPPGVAQPKMEDIDAGQSKAILEVLAEADFNKQFPDLQNLTPMTVFYQLQVGEKEGWKLPQPNATPAQVNESAKTWLKDNSGTYRIKRYVAAKNEK